MALEQERDYYRTRKEELLRTNKGQFAVIKQQTLLGTFTTFEEAFKAGIDRWGNQPFLIQRIEEKEEIVQHPALTVGMINAHS